MKNRPFKLLNVIILTLVLIMNSSVVFAKESTKNIRIYFANGDWQYTSSNITIPPNEKKPYLYALNQSMSSI
ncbi:MAG: hypothetical protein WA131_05780 [Desulfitobacteriaceae bacterium]